MNLRQIGAGVSLLFSLGSPAYAEDDAKACAEAVEHARLQAAALPANDLSRRFAEHDLRTALIELGAGDPDECAELVQRAVEVIATRPYVLRPGERLNGYGPEAAR